MNLGLIPYTGSKTALLKDLKALFPAAGSYSRLVDCFCGGLSVSLNAGCPVLSNDYDVTLIDMYKKLKQVDDFSQIVALAEEHGMSKDNPDAYYKLRDAYNAAVDKDPLMLYLLILHAFSNLNRTNGKGEFNTPFGENRGGINPKTIKRFEHFKANVHQVEFRSGSFADLDILDNDFVYCDPPYLITKAVYNKLWGDDMEKRLYAWLDGLNARGVRFGVSNVTHHAGKTNDILIEWMQKYQVHNLDKNYVLGHHQDSFEKTPTQEVYVCNYAPVNTNPITIDDFM